MSEAQPRNEARKHFSDHDRIILLEQDADRGEKVAADIKAIRGMILQAVIGLAVAVLMLGLQIGIGR